MKIREICGKKKKAAEKKKSVGKRRELGMLQGFLTETIKQQPVFLLIPGISNESNEILMKNNHCVTVHNNTNKQLFIKLC